MNPRRAHFTVGLGGALRRHRPGRRLDDVRLESGLGRIDGRGLDANVFGQSADPYAADASLSKFLGKPSVLEGGVLILVEPGALRHDNGRLGEREPRMELSAPRILDTVHGPR